MNCKKYILPLVLVLTLFVSPKLHSQEIAVKTNLLGDGLLSPNLGIEFLAAPQWTLDFTAHYQPFASSDNRRFKHWFIQPEIRRWLCTPFAGHFFGAHLLGGRYNIGNVHLPLGIYKGTREFRYEGWVLGAGLSYGYHWVLSTRWSIEASLGLGVAYSRYDRFRCGNCGEKLKRNENKVYIGPTKAAISLVYMIK